MKRAMTNAVFCWAVLSASLVLNRAGIAAPPDSTPSSDARPYSVVRDDRGTWWFQAADGTRFYSLGVSNVTPEPYQPRANSTFYNPIPTQL